MTIEAYYWKDKIDNQIARTQSRKKERARTLPNSRSIFPKACQHEGSDLSKL